MSEVPCKKRDDYLEWPEYFMAVAFLAAQRSKDPNSQVGACIVNAENKIVGIGYNGMPNGCSDDHLPWERTAASKLDTKYPYVCHAELNAIMNKNSADVKGCTMYVALFPCNECAKLIIQAGIKEVIFMSDKYHDSDEMTAARLLFDMAGVAFSRFWFLFLSVWCTIIGSYRDKISSESREIFFLPTENEIHTKVQQDCH
ncbi:deoxycytidylate deaminase isoform X1 [Vulpes vulpes]|nr:deoxycytidylate deaminase isoform X1 [Canis lupus dingo]XP_025327642.1 deoxycytidylate deaminase isoform X1 [Canis lupus dingo]XP_025871595.1 deoxycytidylate deaminase isoform X1 [Vulpes vulpes]XP_038318759.1 deoxycytidylate deaminase isoform X1 [Canis lupus familiaris]XP_038318760.1 deoxycytidylate deaminase isoform X1 [Canis lupus familiaris]XP_038416383.1 deoxycytidylate deaminase isoform X1 [Canis lupus familiaris]XP_038416384.1 deoxycytidylate deaminase isoform X1 [Canis lupus familia